MPVGLNLESGYELAELKLQWLVCDFGRRIGQYNQAGLAADIAQLQTDRATRRSPTTWRPPTIKCSESGR